MASSAWLKFGESGRIFYELDWTDDRSLLEAMRRCVEAQKATATESLRSFHRHPDAEREVSPEALEAILRAGTQISGIGTEREISNVIAFNLGKVEGATISAEVRAAREQADALVSSKLLGLFRNPRALQVKHSGHFWYPPGGYMSWHTNLRTPGWRFYINYVEEPGKSFFRYRDPETGRIITSTDKQWNFRLFRITPDKPLWHAISSETNRFSLGYRVSMKASIFERVTKTLAGLAGASRR